MCLLLSSIAVPFSASDLKNTLSSSYEPSQSYLKHFIFVVLIGLTSLWFVN